MEVFAATPSAQAGPSGKPKASPEGFDKALDRATAESTPPGANPPEKESNSRAGEVAETEQKTPPQKLDSQPETGRDATTVANLTSALVAALFHAPAQASNDNAAPSDKAEPTPTQQTQAAVAVGQAVPAGFKPVGLTNSTSSNATQAADSSDSDGEETGDEASGTPNGVSIAGLDQPELGKVKVKVQRITAEDTDPRSSDEDEGAAPVSTGGKPPIFGDSDKIQPIAAPATAKLAEASKPEGQTQPLSSEHRDLVFRQVSDRMELLSATRPKEAVTIHLNPPDLGNVTVVLKNEGVKLSAEFFASHDGVREALKQDSSKFAEQMQSKGVAMTHITVSAGSQPQQAGSNTHYRENRQSAAGDPGPDGQARREDGRQQPRTPFAANTNFKENTAASVARWSGRLTAVDLSI